MTGAASQSARFYARRGMSTRGTATPSTQSYRDTETETHNDDRNMKGLTASRHRLRGPHCGPHGKKKSHEYQERENERLLYSWLFFLSCAAGAKSMLISVPLCL